MILSDPISTDLTLRQARLIFNALPHIGPVLCGRLKSAFEGDLAAALRSPKSILLEIPGIGPIAAETILNYQQHVDVTAIERQLQAKAVEFITPEDSQFPPLLKQMPDTPIGLYVKGSLRPQNKTVAIVGSRRATLYGLSVAKKLASGLASLGYTIISGLARGIDAAAHEGALEANGPTVAILGTGVDLIYPPEHESLYERIVKNGAVFSEFPLSRPADRQTFPLRNRIIAGMAMATIVVESDVHGGSMITARLAGEYGRLLFAVPGRIDQPASRGCHALIRDGATLLTSVDDCIEALMPLGQMDLGLGNTSAKPQPTPKVPLSGDEALLFDFLVQKGACSIDALMELSRLPVHQIAGILLCLEMKSCIVKRVDGCFEAR